MVDSQHASFSVDQVKKEVDRVTYPPAILLVPTIILGCASAVGTLWVSRFDDLNIYSLDVALIFVFCIFAAIMSLHMLRMWGRNRLCELLGTALLAKGQVAIESWAIAYRQLDGAVLACVRPCIHLILTSELSEMPDSKGLYYPLLIELNYQWRRIESIQLCYVILRYLARYGSQRELNMLKGGFARHSLNFDSLELSQSVQYERDALLELWESRF